MSIHWVGASPGTETLGFGTAPSPDNCIPIVICGSDAPSNIDAQRMSGSTIPSPHPSVYTPWILCQLYSPYCWYNDLQLSLSPNILSVTPSGADLYCCKMYLLHSGRMSLLRNITGQTRDLLEKQVRRCEETVGIEVILYEDK